MGFLQPNLVANDDLHPSEIPYNMFVERILPKAKTKLGFNLLAPTRLLNHQSHW